MPSPTQVLKLLLGADRGSTRVRPLLQGMFFTICAARRLGDGQRENSPSESAGEASLQSDAACSPSCALDAASSTATVLVIRRRRALIRATRAVIRSSPLDMLGDAAERAEAGLGLGVLLRTTD